VAQLVGEATEGAGHAHPGSVDGLGLKLTGYFGKAPLNLDSCHDDLAIT
jgi:hypothetical protein